MTEVLTSAQMRAVERAAIDSGAVTGLELMERAGAGVVAAVLAEWPDLATGPHRAVVLCGPGNNGGDGFVVARLLAERGWEVEVFLYGDPERMPPDARRNHDRWCRLGPVAPLPFAALPGLRGGEGVVVDALFGIGLSRGLGADLAQGVLMVFDRPEFFDWRRVAIDVPSGLCADSGRMLTDDARRGPAFRVDLTVTFHRLKPGHVLEAGPRHCGRVVGCDIGLPLIRRQADVVWLIDRQHDTASLGKRGHKYDNGHALVLSGGPGAGGAARLAARGALRIGAGLVTIGCPPEALAENAARLDAVMLRLVADGAALAEALEDRRITAFCLGPGMGTGPREADLLAVALCLPVPGVTRDLGSRGAEGGAGGPGSSPGRDRPGRPVVLDADALTILSQAPDLAAALHPRCVLSPHAGEFARLFPDIAAKLAAPATKGPAFSKVDATRKAAARAGCVVLFKGPDTVIADPSGRCAIHSAHDDRAAPWLATAGSGDVLAGFITGLLARDFDPFDAACTAAWLHVECARSFGPGLIADDLPEELPRVLRSLGL